MSALISLLSLSIFIHLAMWSRAEEPRVHHRSQINGVTFQGMSSHTILPTSWNNPVTHIATDTQSLDRILISTRTSISLLNWREGGEELLVGSLTQSGFNNGQGGQARFKLISSFALFNYSKVYVVDTEAHCIRAFERPENNVVPFIGRCNQTGGDYSGLKLIATDQVDGVIYFTTNGAKIYKNTGNHLSGAELIGERPGSQEYEGILLDENHRTIYLTTYLGEIVKFDVKSQSFSDITYSLSKGHRDGLRVDAIFNSPKSLVLLNKNTLLVGDVGNHVIRVVDLKESGAVSTICERNNGGSQHLKFGKINECVIKWPAALLYSPERKSVFVGSRSHILELQLKFADDDYASPIFRPNVNGAEFGKVSLFFEFDVDPNQYVTTTHIEADMSSSSRVVLSTTTTITTIDMLTLEMSHLVGRLDVAAYKEGQGPKAKFQSITSFAQLNRSALLAVDSDSNCIRMVDRVTATTSPFFGTCKADSEAGATFVRLNQIATSVDRTQVFFTSGPFLYKLNMADATAQLLNGHSSDRTYVAMHVNKETGVMYFATNYDRIVKYDPGDAFRHTPVSLRAEVGYKDGQLVLAQFDFPEGLTMIDRHTLLVADQNNRVVRVVDLASRKVSSICRKHSFDPPNTGVVSTCKISKPSSIAYLPEFSIVMVGTDPHLYTINVNKGNTAQHKPLHIPKVNGIPFGRVTPFYHFPTNERGKVTHMEVDLSSPDHLLISTTGFLSRLHLDTFNRQVLLDTSQVTTTALRFPAINVFSQLNENELVLASFTCLPKFYRSNSSLSVFHGNCNHGDSEKGINQMVLSKKTGLLYFANGSTIYSKMVDGGSVYEIGSRPGSAQYESMQMNPTENIIYLLTYYGLLVSLDLRTRKFNDMITQFTPGHRDGLLHEAQFSDPVGLAVINEHTVLVADLQNHMVRVVDLSSPGRVSSICKKNSYGLVKEGSMSGCLINQPTALLHLPIRQAVIVGALPDLYMISLMEYVTESAEIIYRTEVNKQSFGKVKRFQKLDFGPGVDERITHMEVDFISANRILVSTTTSMFVLNLDTGARTKQLGITGSSGYQDRALTDARFKRISSFVQLNKLQVVVADSGAKCLRHFNRVDNSLSVYYGECSNSGFTHPTYRPVDLMTIDRRRDCLYFSNGATVYQKRTQEREVELIGNKQGAIRYESMQMDEAHNILYLITYHGLLVKLEINGKVFTEITSRFAPGYHDGFFHEAQFSAARGMALLNSKTLMVADTPNNVVRVVDLSSTERVSSICAENKYKVEQQGNIKECLLDRPSSILHIPERSIILVGTSPNIFVIEPKEDNAVVRGSYTYRARVNRLKFEDVIPSYDFEKMFNYSMLIRITHLEQDKLTPSQVIISTTRTISVLDLNTDEHTIISGDISETDYIEGNRTQARFIYITCFSQLHSGDILVVERAASCIRYINRSSLRTSPLYGRCSGDGKYGNVLDKMERLEINKNNNTLYISNGNTLYQLVYANDNQPELLGTKSDVKYFEDMRLDNTGSYLYLATNYDQLIKFDLVKKEFRRVSYENIPGHLDGSLKEALFHSPASLTFANDETMLVADSINRVVRVVDLTKKKRVSSICQNKNLEKAREGNIQKCVIGHPTALVYLSHHSTVFIAGSGTFFLMNVTANKVTVDGTYIHRDVVNRVQFGDVELFHKFAETRMVPDSYEETTHMELDLQDTSKVLVSTTRSISVLDLESHARTILVGDIAEKGHVDGVGIDARFVSISHFAQLSEHSLIVVDSGANCVRTVNRTTAATSIAFGQCRDSSNLDDILDSVQKISVDRSRARVYVASLESIYKFRNGKLKLMGTRERVGHYNAMQLDSAGAYLYLVTFYDQLLKFNLEKKIFSEVTAQTTAGHQDGPLSEALFFAPKSLAFLNKETLLVADSFNKVIRVVDLSERGRVSSICYYSPSATVQLGSIRMCFLPSTNAILYVPNMAAVLIGTDPDLYVLRLLKTGPKSLHQNGGLLLTTGSMVGYAFICLALLYSYY